MGGWKVIQLIWEENEPKEGKIHKRIINYVFCFCASRLAFNLTVLARWNWKKGKNFTKKNVLRPFTSCFSLNLFSEYYRILLKVCKDRFLTDKCQAK